jgi:hypothetical protein
MQCVAAFAVNVFKCTCGYCHRRPTFKCNIRVGGIVHHVQGKKRGSCSCYEEVGIDATEPWFLTAQAGLVYRVSIGTTVIYKEKQEEKVEKEREVKER